MSRPAVVEVELGDGLALLALHYGFDRAGGLVADLALYNGEPRFIDHRVALLGQRARARFREGARAALPEVDAAALDAALLKMAGGLLQLLTQKDAGAPPGASSAGDDRAQATQLVGLAAGWDLFHDAAGTAYATLPGRGGERQTWRLQSKAVRQQLAHLFYTLHARVPRAQAVQDALGVLAGRALFAAPQREVHTRLAGYEGALYLDLGNDAWEAVAIGPTGWRVVASAAVPVTFRRARGMLALPHPQHGGQLAELRPFLNVAAPPAGGVDAAWILQVAWLLGALRPRGPYPVLALGGEQGSAKSTTARVLRRLIDPNSAALRGEPRDLRDLMIAATNSWVVGLDNLSHLQPWLSDALCQLATGGGFAARALYSDDEEVLFEAQRPVLLNGIEEVTTRADLLDRALVLTLPQIPEDRRRPEERFWRDFEQAHPRILGALLDAVAAALHNAPNVRLDRLPRLADFALWVAAAEPACGWPAGSFLLAYAANRQEANVVALESSPLAPTVQALVEERGTWRGTAAELLDALKERVDDSVRRQRGWPARPHALSGLLRRIAPNLRAAGISVTFTREATHRRQRLIELARCGGGKDTAPDSSQAEPGEHPTAGPAPPPAATPALALPEEKDPGLAVADAPDAADAPVLASSAHQGDGCGTDEQATLGALVRGLRARSTLAALAFEWRCVQAGRRYAALGEEARQAVQEAYREHQRGLAAREAPR